MCTVTWLRSGGRYALLSNRDEKRTRLEAAPPSRRTHRGISYLAPTDPQFGGTWIATNECGVSVCLLNGRGAQRGDRSRGEVVEHVAASQGDGEVWPRLRRLALASFAPFVLLVIGGGATQVLEWNGRRLSRRAISAAYGILTSSSFEPDAVHHARLAAFRRRRIDQLQDLIGFHSSHDRGRTAWSVCMHRDDAATVSLTRIIVTPIQRTMIYQPGAPCERHPAVSLVL